MLHFWVPMIWYIHVYSCMQKPLDKKWLDLIGEKRIWKHEKSCHVSTFLLISTSRSTKKTLWGDLTFCHQADYVSCRFKSPQIFPHIHRHTVYATKKRLISESELFCLFFFLWVYGSLRTGQQRYRERLNGINMICPQMGKTERCIPVENA